MSRNPKPDADAVVASAPVSEPPPAPAKPKPKKAGRLPVDVLAVRSGRVVELGNLASGRKVRRGDAAHQAAATLHGWRDHVAATGEQLSMTAEDYEAAVKAASAPPQGKQALEPHKPALSPHSRLFPRGA